METIIRNLNNFCGVNVTGKGNLDRIKFNVRKGFLFMINI